MASTANNVFFKSVIDKLHAGDSILDLIEDGMRKGIDFTTNHWFFREICCPIDKQNKDSIRLHRVEAIQKLLTLPLQLSQKIIDYIAFFAIMDSNRELFMSVHTHPKYTIDPSYNHYYMFMYAIKNKLYDIFLILIDVLNANVNGNDGIAMQWASYSDDIRYLQKLISCGADVTVRQNEAIRQACLKGNLEMVKLLMEHGADPTYDDCDPFYNCVSADHLEVFQYLYPLCKDKINAEDFNAALSKIEKSKIMEFCKANGIEFN